MYEHYNDMDIDELEFEANDICHAIRNEKIHMFGSKTPEEEVMHYKNIEALRTELKYVINKIKELEA